MKPDNPPTSARLAQARRYSLICVPSMGMQEPGIKSPGAKEQDDSGYDLLPVAAQDVISAAEYAIKQAA